VKSFDKILQLMKKPFFCIVAFILSIGTIQAQSGHYWTQQYGTRSMLLSGSVIGGVSDLGAVFYNPARLGQIDNPAFLISANVYELNRLKVEDAFGNNLDAAKKDFGGVPSLASGTFKVAFLPKHHFAWAIMVRNNQDLNFSYRNEVHKDVIENFPGEEYFGAEVAISLKAKETWTGGSWSYPITDKLSIGVSGFFSQMDEGKSSKIELQALTADNKVAIYRFNKSFSMSHYSILAKAGLSYQFKSGLIGLTVLTPQVKISGNGSYQNEKFFTGIEGESVNPDVYTTSYQNDLNANYKSPWAVGTGLTYFLKKSKIHLSAEWYSKLPKYTMMQIADHYSQSSDDTIRLKVVDEFNSVVNLGLGLEIYLSEKISFYTSFSTDFSAVTNDISRFVENLPETSNTTVKADYYHYGAGFVLNVKSADITLGVTHTGASMKVPKPFNFPGDGGDDSDILDPQDPATLRWDRYRFVFSFSLPFLKDVQKKAEEKLGF
jgi:hypothetical protein